MKTHDLTKMAICITLLCISSYLSFPLPLSPVMITTQTIIINLIALILTPKQAFVTVSLYIIMGLIGLPVFSGGASGLAKILSPTGGFIMGFLIAAPLMSYVKGECVHLKSALCITILIGMPIIYLFGTYWMSLNQGIGIYDAFKVSVIPFVLGDVVKCVIASLVADRLTQRVNQSVFRGQLVNE